MRIRSIAAAAAPLLLAGSLAAATPGLSQASGDKDSSPESAPKGIAGSSRLAAVEPCYGGAQKRAWSGGHSNWFWTSDSGTVPGTQYKFRGPKRKKDTVFVTFTAPHTWVSSLDAGRVRVLLDGVDMEPGLSAAEYFYEETNYGSFAGQYCAKVGSGTHRVRVVLESTGTDDTAYLWNPMVHVEVAE